MWFLRYVSGYWLIYPPKIANISQIRVEIQGPQMQLVFGTPHWKGQFSSLRYWNLFGEWLHLQDPIFVKTLLFSLNPKVMASIRDEVAQVLLICCSLFLNSNLLTMSQFGTKEHALHFQSLFPDRIDSKTSRKKSPNSLEERVIYEDWALLGTNVSRATVSGINY